MRFFIFAALLAAAPVLAQQPYPSRPVTIVVPFPPVVKASDELRSKVRQKFEDQLKR